MKIAVVHNLPDGGQKRALFEELKILNNKHTIHVLTLSHSQSSLWNLNSVCAKFSEYSYAQPSHFPASVLSIYMSLPKVYQEIANDINKGDYNVAYINPCYLTQAPFVLQYLKIPSLYHCAEPKREFYETIKRTKKSLTYSLTLPFRLPIKVIDQVNTRKATKVMVNSEFSKNEVDNIYDIKSIVNYLGVDTTLFKNLSIPKLRQILTVGNLSLLKGHDFIIEAVSKIPEHIRPNLVIVGSEGPDEEYIRDLAQRNKVLLRIEKNITDQQLVKLYNESSVYAFAAIREPFGLTILESAACGLPVVAVSEGGVMESTRNLPNSSIVPRDPFSFATLLQRNLVSNQIESKKQIEYVNKNWSWRAHADRIEKILKETAKIS